MPKTAKVTPGKEAVVTIALKAGKIEQPILMQDGMPAVSPVSASKVTVSGGTYDDTLKQYTFVVKLDPTAKSGSAKFVVFSENLSSDNSKGTTVSVKVKAK